MKRMLFWLLVLVLSLSPVFAADQWEYMVVSKGKENFDSDSGKVTACNDVVNPSLNSYESEQELESVLNELGSEGWEVVSVVGKTGEGQKIILKRTYDESRYLDDLAKADSLKLFEADASKEFVEMDEAENIMTKDEYESMMENNMKHSITTLFQNFKMKTPFVFLNSDSVLDFFYISLYFDMTRELLIGENGYRKSQVDEKADEIYQILQELSESYPRQYLNVFFSINFLSEGYKEKEVGSYKATFKPSSAIRSNSVWSFEEL